LAEGGSSIVFKFS